jgi:hypothetical protein
LPQWDFDIKGAPTRGIVSPATGVLPRHDGPHGQWCAEAPPGLVGTAAIFDIGLPAARIIEQHLGTGLQSLAENGASAIH